MKRVQILHATVVPGVKTDGNLVEPVSFDGKGNARIVVVEVEDDVAEQLRGAGKGRVLRKEGEEGEKPAIEPLPIERVPGAAKVLARLKAEAAAAIGGGKADAAAGA